MHRLLPCTAGWPLGAHHPSHTHLLAPLAALIAHSAPSMALTAVASARAPAVAGAASHCPGRRAAAAAACPAARRAAAASSSSRRRTAPQRTRASSSGEQPAAPEQDGGSQAGAALGPRDDDVLPDSLTGALEDASRATVEAMERGVDRCVVRGAPHRRGAAWGLAVGVHRPTCSQVEVLLGPQPRAAARWPCPSTGAASTRAAPAACCHGGAGGGPAAAAAATAARAVMPPLHPLCAPPARQVEILLPELWDPLSGPVYAEEGDQQRWWKLTRRFLDNLAELQPGKKIREQTRAHVRRVAEDLGYRPNLQAQAMKRRTARTIGLLSIWETGSFVFPPVVNGLKAVCDREGLALTTAPRFWPAPQVPCSGCV